MSHILPTVFIPSVIYQHRPTSSLKPLSFKQSQPPLPYTPSVPPFIWDSVFPGCGLPHTGTLLPSPLPSWTASGVLCHGTQAVKNHQLLRGEGQLSSCHFPQRLSFPELLACPSPATPFPSSCTTSSCAPPRGRLGQMTSLLTGSDWAPHVFCEQSLNLEGRWVPRCGQPCFCGSMYFCSFSNFPHDLAQSKDTLEAPFLKKHGGKGLGE